MSELHVCSHEMLFYSCMYQCRPSPFDWELTEISESTDSLPRRELPQFEHSSGPTERTIRENTPLKIFQLFITQPILELIIQQSNLYAMQAGEFLSLSVEELLAFIGLNVAMGMVRLPRLHDYWSTKPMFRMPWFSAIMSRDRFFKISRYLHLVDSSKQQKRGEMGYDPLYKVRPLVDKVRNTFDKYYMPGRELAIDEMMVGTRCRIHFLQYLPKKPTKWGVKVFVNAESTTGYVLTFDVYTGGSETTSTHDTVMKLMEKYLDKGHKLFTDNFYSSPLLCHALLQRGTYTCGTVRTNRRHFPDGLKYNKLERPQYRFATSGKCTAGIWYDRRDVTFVSTIHSASVEIVEKRRKGEKDKEPIPCPTAIVEYNQYMNGVDLADQHLSYHSLTVRKTTKWWKKLYWRLIDLCILNSSIVFRQNHPNEGIKNNREFRLILVEQLVKPLLDSRVSRSSPLGIQPAGRRPSDDLIRLRGKHFLYRGTPRKRCVVCSGVLNATKRRKDTKVTTYCPKCNQHMCMGTCFEKYHTLVDYKH